MQIVVLINNRIKEEFHSNSSAEISDIVWIEDYESFKKYPEADVYIDFLFGNTKKRLHFLNQLLPSVVMVNSVVHTLAELDENLIRFNGWPTFLKGALIEAACFNEASKSKAEQAMDLFGKKIEWLPDEPGFVTPRVVSMIINEAHFALSENVSTKEEIDLAMKLGTAYPLGPFEWAEKIGMQNIVLLLNKMNEKAERYKPCDLLIHNEKNSI